MRLVFTELKKLWSKKEFLLYSAVLIFANLFLLWIDLSSAGQKIPYSAYKKMTRTMSSMTMEEKQEYIAGRYEEINRVVKIDNVMKMSRYDKEGAFKLMNTDYAEEFSKYGEIYKQKAYLVYTDNLYSEYYFMEQMQDEIELSAGYKDFLESIQKKSEQLSQISIFNKEGSYDSLNIKATAEAYKDIENIETDYYPQTGFVKAVSFRYSDLILLFSMLLLASCIIREEKDSDMLTLIRTAPSGRGRTSAAKLAAMSASLLVMVTLIYIVNLLFCNRVYGLGDLSRSIQSVPYLMRSTLRVNIYEYILLFIFTKWIASAICGAWVLFAILITKNVFGGYILSLALPAANLLIRSSIPATSAKNVIKYANLASFLTTNEILGGYRNLHWFGKPVTLFKVELISAAIYFALFVTVFVCAFEYGDLGKSGQKRGGLSLFNTKKATTVEKQEWYKTLVMNGAGAVLLLFSAYMGYTAYTAENYITADEMFFAHYMKQVTGPYDEEARDFLIEAQEKFAPILKAEQMRNARLISGEEYLNIINANYSLNMEYNAYLKVLSKVEELKYYPGSQLIYDTGYNVFFDFNDILDLKDYMICILAVVLCTCGRFTVEKTGGMGKVISVTPLGAERTVKRKIRVAAGICFGVAVALLLPRVYRIASGYGFKGLFVTANSMSAFRGINKNVLMIELVLLMLAARVITALTAGYVTLYISGKSDNYISCAMISLLILEFPALLAFFDLEWAKYLTLYPAFHIIANMRVWWRMCISAVYLAFALYVNREVKDWLLWGVKTGKIWQ